MAIVFEDLSLTGIRKAHLSQLLSYIETRDETGWYYGNRTQFEKRHNDLKIWIQDAVDYAYKEGIVMPKK